MSSTVFARLMVLMALAAALPLQGCQRPMAPPASTAELAARIRSEPVREHQQLIDAFVLAHPTNPIVDGTSVSFLVSSDERPRLIGDFNGWGAASPSSGRMRRLGRTKWFSSTVRVPRDARVEYLIEHGAAVEPDTRNPRRVVSVGGEASEVAMPDFESQAELDAAHTAPAGHVEEHMMGGDEATSGRRVAIYTPPGYDPSIRYPVVFFHDGTLMLTGGVPRILDVLQAQQRIVPLVAVFVDPVSRADDYKMSDVFRRFFLDELVPWAEQHVNLATDPSARAIVGVSRGAIAALDLALSAPERFGGCGLIIPSFAPTPLLDVLSTSPLRAIRFAVVAANFDREWLVEAQTLDAVLDSKGYDRSMHLVQEGHNVQAWRGHIDDVLVPFFGRE